MRWVVLVSGNIDLLGEVDADAVTSASKLAEKTESMDAASSELTPAWREDRAWPTMSLLVLRKIGSV